MTARFCLVVLPGARRNEVIARRGGTWRIRVAAPPIAGRANRELVAYLATLLGRPPSAIHIARGTSGRHKTIDVEGLTVDQVMARLEAVYTEET